ncbi:MAG TPA: hypothetical protein VJ276_16825 [Thermoanaerobaculia bacterium]|nr:hypothetical protein [Thermoanaerobaculia bacterium]
MTKQFRTNLFPRNHLHLAGIYLPDAALDLFRPRCLDVGIGLTIESLKQLAGKLGAVTVRKFHGLSKELFELSSHDLDSSKSAHS